MTLAKGEEKPLVIYIKIGKKGGQNVNLKN
jgi:hypothetical protein